MQQECFHATDTTAQGEGGIWASGSDRNEWVSLLSNCRTVGATALALYLLGDRALSAAAGTGSPHLRLAAGTRILKLLTVGAKISQICAARCYIAATSRMTTASSA